MNKSRRIRLDEIAEKLDALKTDIELIQDEEQEAFDNLPESLQGGEKGDKMQECIDNLGYAADNLQDAIDNINDANL